MTNHVHLLLTPEKAEAVPKLIISLGRCYVQYINRSYRRTGTLWDSRYKSSLVQADTYLLVCQRYIEFCHNAGHPPRLAPYSLLLTPHAFQR